MEEEKKIADVILETAQGLLQTKDTKYFTMREIAKGSGIALGTIYNYYSTKDDIILALVEEFWAGALEGLYKISRKDTSFINEIREMHLFLLCEFSKFESDWMGLLRGISKPRKKEGLSTEQKVQRQMCQLIGERLKHYHPEPWRNMQKDDFAGFICDNVFFSLTHQREDINILLQIISEVIKNQTAEKKGILE